MMVLFATSLPARAASTETAVTVERSPASARIDERDFAGMGYLFPLRLTLVYGGVLDGALGGVNGASHELLLIRPQRSFRIHFRLISSVESLASLLPPSADGLRPPAPAIQAKPLQLRWTPTWRSHLGAVMSFVLPGTGQFIQEDERALGVLFLLSDLFFVSASVLALFAPSELAPHQRRFVGGTFAGLALTTSFVSSIHAFRAGRVRSQVKAE